MEIKIITYEEDRLNYFTKLMKKAQKRYNRLFKKFKDAPVLSSEAEILSDAGRETHFFGDVVEMLEKGYHKQSEGYNAAKYPDGAFECSVCHFSNWDTTTADTSTYNFCPNCGEKMKGGDGK